MSDEAKPSESPRPESPKSSTSKKALVGGKIWAFLRIMNVRLRFIVLMVIIGLVAGNWENIMNHYDRWRRPAEAPDMVAAKDIEYYCPMHPNIISSNPGNCPLCGMPLSKRKISDRPEGEALPAGVVSRVQLTPYRIAVADIQTSAIGYRPLVREIRTVGFVEFDETKVARISVRLPGRTRIDELKVNVTGAEVKKGDPLAIIYNADLVFTMQNLLDAHTRKDAELETAMRQRLDPWGIDKEQIDEFLAAGKPVTRMAIRAPISGHVIKKYQWQGEYVEEGARLYDVADLHNVWVEAQVFEEDLPYLKEDMNVSATTPAYPNREFEGRIAFIQPHLDAGTRTLRVRFDMKNPRPHELRPGMYATVKLQLPVTQTPGFVKALRENLWQGNLVDSVVRLAARPAGPAPDLGLQPLLRSAGQLALTARGTVLAVPESAVIDTGGRKIVYRQVEFGKFDGVEVQLGPRSEGYYPVLRGLDQGDVVATVGSFLIDAETRLNPSVGSTYFGAGGTSAADKHVAAHVRPSMVDDLAAKIPANLAKLDAKDRQLAQQQEYCPILKNSKLGSMGRPVKLTLQGETVFLCCTACIDEAKANPEKTVARVRELRAGKGRPAADVEEAEIRKELAKLSPEDRRLAEQQRFCVVQTQNRLGSMGVPIKKMVNGQPVFICCESCAPTVRDHPDRVLQNLKQLGGKR